MKSKSLTILEELKSNWVFITFAVFVIIWYADTNSRLNNVEALSQENKTTLEQVIELKTDIAVIKTDISYIKEKIR